MDYKNENVRTSEFWTVKFIKHNFNTTILHVDNFTCNLKIWGVFKSSSLIDNK